MHLTNKHRTAECYLHYQMQMDLLTVATIYFACGSPIVMHYVLSTDRRGIGLFFSTALRALAWPIFGGYMVSELLKKQRVSAIHRRMELANGLRDKLETRVYTKSSTTDIFGFRFVFDKYVALNDAALDYQINNGVSLFLSISEHNNIDLAKACVDRKMRSRILAHTERARQDIAQLLSANVTEDDLAELQELTGDIRLASLVRSVGTDQASALSTYTRKAA